MKAITLHQPYATLMAIRAKTIETRSFRISYRGDIAICAGLSSRSLKMAMDTESIVRVLEAAVEAGMLADRRLPTGKVLAVAELYDVKETWRIRTECLNVLEADFGDYGPGRYGWFTRKLRRLPEPVPVRGFQGLFNLPPEVEAAVNEQLKHMPAESPQV